MKGYWLILGTEVIDEEAQKAYGALWTPIGEKYGATLIPGARAMDLVEARDAKRTLLVEFPSISQAKACYDDPAYRHALEFAMKGSKRTLVILEGSISVN